MLNGCCIASKSYLPTPPNISISVKRLKLRLSGSARKSQKRFRDTPRFKFQAVLARTQPFPPRSAEKRGDQSRFKSLGLRTNVGRSRYRCCNSISNVTEIVNASLACKSIIATALC